MNRVAKIIIYALVLFLLYLWISTIAQSCNSSTAKEGAVMENEDEGYSSDEEIYDEYFEADGDNVKEGAEATADQGGVEEEVNAKQETSNEPAEEYDEDFTFEKKEKTKLKATSAPKATKKSTTQPQPKSTSTTSSGKYIVVAGSYLIKDNADKMVSKLRKMGFSNADIIVFDASQYYSISGGAFSSYDAASNTAKKIKNQGIDCYVHTRK